MRRGARRLARTAAYLASSAALAAAVLAAAGGQRTELRMEMVASFALLALAAWVETKEEDR